MYYLGLVIIGIIGFLLGKKLARIRAVRKEAKKDFSNLSKTEMKEMRGKANTALSERTEERKEEILEYIKKEMAHQEALANCSIEDRKEGITREDVEKLLDVSSTTALKYLNELEQEKKILQSTPYGPDVCYTLS